MSKDFYALLNFVNQDEGEGGGGVVGMIRESIGIYK